MQTDRMPVLELRGRPRERGRAHGETLRLEIAAVLAAWRSVVTLPPGVTFEAFTDRFLRETHLIAALKRWTPDLYDEACGIAEGANQSLDLILAFQCGDDARWFVRDHLAAAPGFNDRCSALAFLGDSERPTVVAENVDIGLWADGAQALLAINDPVTGMESLIFTIAGTLGVNGINSHGVAVACNSLLQLASNRQGLPVAGMVRAVLTAPSYVIARRILHDLPHATGQNYMLADAVSIGSFECSGSRVYEAMPPEGGRFLHHTNHPLWNDDLAIPFQHHANLASIAAAEVNSSRRLTRLEALTRGRDASLSLEAAKDILRDQADEAHPLCRLTGVEQDGSACMTVAATIFVASDAPALHIAAGPPSVAAFQHFTCGAGR
jgi:hypothetical protein